MAVRTVKVSVTESLCVYSQSCPKNMHSQIFGCLLDLAENPKALPHISTWRGHDDTSAAHLFCDKWREEERVMGVKRDSKGAIAGELPCGTRKGCNRMGIYFGNPR